MPTASIPKHILFATDLSARCDRALDRSLRLARQWGCRLTLLHVLEKPRPGLTDVEREAEEMRISDTLRDEVADSPADVTTLIASGPVAATIAETAARTDAELIVTGVAHHDELGDFILGTNVDRLARQSRIPILVVKARARFDYRAILVATDFSTSSADALELAASFFPGAILNLAHAYQVGIAPITRDAQASAHQARIAEELDEFLDDIGHPGLSRRIDVHIDCGEVKSVITDLARSLPADLGVIGVRGQSGFIPARIGSNASALTQNLPCDVLLVPDQML